MKKHREVAVIGTGLIGQAWALVFARGQCNVRLWDGNAQALQRAMTLIQELALELQKSGLVANVGELMSRIRICAELADALDGVDHGVPC